MMAIAEAMMAELEQEAETTRRVLERVPEEHIDWRPHERSRTLGELAMHIATVPGAIAQMVGTGPTGEIPNVTPPRPRAADLLPAHDESIATARRILTELDDARMHETWRLMAGDRELFALPRVAMLRSVMLNHWYHHRGQLSVYLRELDIPIPSIYGPSADENPFAA